MTEQINSGEGVVDEVTAPRPPSVGEQLAAARQARGLEVQDIAQALKLGPRQVEALEQGAWQALPGQTFTRGFVRNYARLVQIDPAPLMAQLDAILERPVNSLSVPASRPAEMPQSGGTVSRRDRVVVLTGAGLVLLAALAYFLMPNDISSLRESAQGVLDSLSRKDEAPAAAGQASASTAESQSEPAFPPGATPQQIMNPQALVPAEVTAPAPLPDAGEPAQIKPLAPVAVDAPASAANTPQMRFVFDKESWLEVRDRDNKLIFSQRVAGGSEQLLSGNGPLSLTIGYAPGVRLFWRGQSVDLAPHTRGDVARLVLE